MVKHKLNTEMLFFHLKQKLRKNENFAKNAIGNASRWCRHFVFP